MNMAALDFKDARGQAIDEVAIMRDHHHRSAKTGDSLEQNVLGAEVEVIGRLVQ